MKNNKLVYTPEGIPLGEPTIGPDGTIGLKIKKDNITEYVSLDYIFTATIRKIMTKT